MKHTLLLIAILGIALTTKAQITESPDGNVGIGTINTDAKLRIQGSKSLARFKTEDDGLFEIQATRSDTTCLITSLKLSSQNHIILDPNVFGTSGNVGIGITNPIRKLDVNGKIAGRETIAVLSGGGYLVALNGQEHGYVTGRNSAFENKFKIASDGNSYLNGGNVGIGTTAPSSRLQVYRGASGGNPHGFSALTVEDSDNSMISILTPNTKTAYFGFSDSDDDYVGGMQYEHNNDRLVFRTNNHSSDLIIDKDGDVGIGTTNTQGYKLAVAGNVIAEEVKVELQANWPDYVFEENYALPSLQETENYIKQKGHLKDIPTALEVQENGIDLGAMNAKLLQKIEELTLYTIDQQKAIEELKATEKRLEEIEELLESKN